MNCKLERSQSLMEGYCLVSTSGKGDAGNIRINASDTVSFSGVNPINGDPTAAFSNVNAGGVGNGGEINITAGSLELTNGGQLNAFVRSDSGTTPAGNGNAGNVKLNIRNGITIAGVSNEGTRSSINSNVESGAQGKGGNIELQARTVSVADGGLLLVSTSGKGDAGNIRINASDTVSFSGVNPINGNPTAAFSTVEAGGEGNGGEINITAGSLELTNGGQLNAFVRSGSGTTPAGNGNAGNVKLDIRNGITIAGVSGRPAANGIFPRSGIFSNVEVGGVGNAGGIDITARSLSLTNGGRLSSTNFSNGTAGNIKVTTANDIRLDNKASIQANTKNGEGNISLNARDLILRRNSSITTNATGKADGGDIRINTGNLVALEDSNITANAEKGFGGRIFITAQGIFRSPDSDITAISEAGSQFNGTVQFNTPETDPTKGLFEFPEIVTDAAQQVAQNPCQRGVGSSFTITGRGGLPTDPQKVLSSNNVRVDLIKPVTSTVSSTTATEKKPSQQPTVKRIIPAQGWIYNEKGQVVLVGYDPTKTGPQRQPQTPASSCAAVR
ncbi:S-layer family protein [Brasilonema sennae]|nr:S-layer family protein [Brasilonema sennae]